MSRALSSRIRRAREREGLTRAALAEKMDVSPAAIGNWENGAEPNAANKRLLKRVLGNLYEKPIETLGPKAELTQETQNEEISSFGIWLREHRVKSAYSVPELSELAKVSTVAIYNIESGKIQNPQAATRDKLAKALKQSVPQEIVAETETDQEIIGLGSLVDFDPHSKPNWPSCSGVYVLYDISQRPIYVGMATKKISSRLAEHFEKFWFKAPIIQYGSFIEVKDQRLCKQLEQVLIRFLKSNAVVNKQSAERFEDERMTDAD